MPFNSVEGAEGTEVADKRGDTEQLVFRADFTWLHRWRDAAVMPAAHDFDMELGRALTIIQMDYVEMPGLILTLHQGRRLWTLPLDVCQAALETLAAAGFLLRTEDGRYLRAGGPPAPIEALDPRTWAVGRSAA